MPQDHTFKGLDGTFHYLDWGGTGPLTTLAHATGYCAGMYSPLAERLLPRLRVVGLDDRGHGQTQAPADPRRLQNWDVFVEDLEYFLDHFKQPVVAIGHSRGGVVSLLLAVKRPDLIRGLILLDPTILPFSWMWWWFLAKKTGLARRVPIAARAAVRKKVWPDRETVLGVYRGKAGFKSWKEGFLEGYVAYGLRPSENGGVQWCCDPAWESRCFAVCPHDVWGYLPRIKCPTLLLYGADSDTFLPAAARRFKRAVPGATIKAFQATSHFVPMERPDETQEAIFEFLDTHGLV